MLMFLIKNTNKEEKKKNTNKGNESSKTNPGIYYQVTVNSQKFFKNFPYEYGNKKDLLWETKYFVVIPPQITVIPEQKWLF